MGQSVAKNARCDAVEAQGNKRERAERELYKYLKVSRRVVGVPKRRAEPAVQCCNTGNAFVGLLENVSFARTSHSH